MENKRVSVVITTKNEQKHIANCLTSIQHQTYPEIEMIVVDNQSSDRTKSIAEGFTSLVFDKGPERSAQRNYGMIDIATGNYVMFVDADMILSPTLIERCVEQMQQTDHDALHLPEIVLGTCFFSRVRRFERSFYDGTVIDGARFFRKKAFVEVGGFDLTMSGPEDWDIDKKIKLNGTIGCLSNETNKKGQVAAWPLASLIIAKGGGDASGGDVIFHNESEFDIKAYLKKKTYYSQSFNTYIKKWGRQDKDIRRQLGIGYRYFGVFFENSKWKKVVRRPELFLGVFFLRVLVGVTFILGKKEAAA